MTLLLCLLLAGAPSGADGAPIPPQAQMNASSDEQVLSAIAADIEGLKKSFPQLADFSAKKNFDASSRTISYAYHTHPPKNRPGWAGGVPNPDADGVWFHIDFHDPSSTAQIHTQPVYERLTFGDQVVMLLILEGPKTRSVGGELRKILLAHGVTAP